MANIKIAQLTNQTAISDNDLVIIETATSTNKMTVGKFKELIGGLAEVGSVGEQHYIKYSDGRLEQYGFVEAPESVSSATVSFPVNFIDFTKVVLNANLQYVSANGGSLQTRNIVTCQMTQNNLAYIYSVFSDGATPANKRRIAYRAIGRWK